MFADQATQRCAMCDRHLRGLTAAMGQRLDRMTAGASPQEFLNEAPTQVQPLSGFLAGFQPIVTRLKNAETQFDTNGIHATPPDKLQPASLSKLCTLM